MKPTKLHVRTGDTVVVISGKDAGKSGKVQKAFPKEGKIVVEGVALVKRHQKPRGQGMRGGIITKESAFPSSKVMLMCPSCKKATRIAHQLNGPDAKVKKTRVCKKCGSVIDN